MTATSDPRDPAYLEESVVRRELARVFSVCDGCRRCVSLCGSFPVLFDLLERIDDRDTGRMTPAQQDRVLDECFHCGRCAIGCPYAPERHEAAVDVPRLVLRATAMRSANGQLPMRTVITRRVLASGVRVGRAGRARPGSKRRRVVASLTGVSAQRVLPPRRKERFSTWLRRRPVRAARATVALVPTCIVEHHAPEVGRDLVAVLDHHGIACTVGAVGCCGATWLHSGDVERFADIARDNVATLAADVRDGREVVVAQPECAEIVRRAYPQHAPGPDADLVAAHVHDATAFVLDVMRDAGIRPGGVAHPVGALTYHSSCAVRAGGAADAGVALLDLLGADVRVVEQCAGVASPWGLRAAADAPAGAAAQRLGRAVAVAGHPVVAGDCHLANVEIAARTGAAPLHPVQVAARALGLDSA
jgi:glycerol-3-phosphate dehydrogenase subunit C